MKETLLFGGACVVPCDVAVCPECGASLFADSQSWDTETGCPTADCFYVYCMEDEDCKHRYWQSDWQDVNDRVRKWAGAK